MKTPAGKYVKAQLDLDKWLTRLIRAAKEVEKHRKRVKYYERLPDRGSGAPRKSKSDLW